MIIIIPDNHNIIISKVNLILFQQKYIICHIKTTIKAKDKNNVNLECSFSASSIFTILISKGYSENPE